MAKEFKTDGDTVLVDPKGHSIVSALYDLQPAGVQSVQPLLTIPVSR